MSAPACLLSPIAIMSHSSDSQTRLSDSLVISCGTITLDPAQARMLHVCWKRNGEVFLPKGRKNIGETLEDAAVRETYEETGVQVRLLPLEIPTLVTPGAAAKLDSRLNTEPVAFSQRTVGHSIIKLIFWFCAHGDSTAAHEIGTQEEGEDLDPVWVNIENAVQTITFQDDKEVAGRVIQLYDLSFHCKLSFPPCSY